MNRYHFALEVIEAGRKLWADVKDEDRGTTFQLTFARGVKVATMRTSFPLPSFSFFFSRR